VEEDEVEDARFDERTALESIFGDDHFQAYLNPKR
jgi:hypothetical protein